MRPGDVSCWLLRSVLPPQDLFPGWQPGQQRVLHRCLRPSYRLSLMHPGDPCVLWVSGPARGGVHAAGTLLSPPTGSGDPGEQPTVQVALRLLPAVVGRADLMGHSGFADAEVVRMAAGSNPSYLTARQLAALREVAARNPLPGSESAARS